MPADLELHKISIAEWGPLIGLYILLGAGIGYASYMLRGATTRSRMSALLYGIAGTLAGGMAMRYFGYGKLLDASFALNLIVAIACSCVAMWWWRATGD